VTIGGRGDSARHGGPLHFLFLIGFGLRQARWPDRAMGVVPAQQWGADNEKRDEGKSAGGALAGYGAVPRRRGGERGRGTNARAGGATSRKVTRSGSARAIAQRAGLRRPQSARSRARQGWADPGAFVAPRVLRGSGQQPVVGQGGFGRPGPRWGDAPNARSQPRQRFCPGPMGGAAYGGFGPRRDVAVVSSPPPALEAGGLADRLGPPPAKMVPGPRTPPVSRPGGGERG